MLGTYWCFSGFAMGLLSVYMNRFPAKTRDDKVIYFIVAVLCLAVGPFMAGGLLGMLICETQKKHS